MKECDITVGDGRKRYISAGSTEKNLNKKQKNNEDDLTAIREPDLKSTIKTVKSIPDLPVIVSFPVFRTKTTRN